MFTTSCHHKSTQTAKREIWVRSYTKIPGISIWGCVKGKFAAKITSNCTCPGLLLLRQFFKTNNHLNRYGYAQGKLKLSYLIYSHQKYVSFVFFFSSNHHNNFNFKTFEFFHLHILYFIFGAKTQTFLEIGNTLNCPIHLFC